MGPKLKTKTRQRLIERVNEGESVSKVCREAGISRVIFYRWLRRYKKEGTAAPKKSQGPRLKRQVEKKRVLRLVALVQDHSKWSAKKLSENLPVSNHGVQNVLVRLDLNTRSKRKSFAWEAKGLTSRQALSLAEKLVEEAKAHKKVIDRQAKLSADQRLEMIKRVINKGEPVSEVCREFEVSRPVFYKWLRRYQDAARGEELDSLENQEAKVRHYYGQTPAAYVEKVIEVVLRHPEWGVRKVAAVLPRRKGKPIVGYHGVQKILKRNHLNTYEKRLVFVESQPKIVTPATRILEWLRPILDQMPKLAVRPPPAWALAVKKVKPYAPTLILAISVILVLVFPVRFWWNVIWQAPTVQARWGLTFAFNALLVGSFFFIYSMKSYLTLAVVLSFSRHSLEEGEDGSNSRKSSVFGWLGKIFGVTVTPLPSKGQEKPAGGGLQPSLDHIKLNRYPFVSVHLPLYNEKLVVERLLKAVTAMDYPNYEVIVCDDSNDETIKVVDEFVKNYQREHPDGPKLKVSRRSTRKGFKGKALAGAVEKMDPRTEFVVVFDADFVPYPDTLELFVKYFKVNNGGVEKYTRSNVAVVGGYQWHVLNKSENWITRGVRSEYAGSYVIERSGREIMGLLKQISGSVYMIRADVLKKIGWGTSITEDFELTLKLYEKGYKVLFTPYVQAPAECVSTLKRLIRQRMRWAEGHSYNIKKMFRKLMVSPKLTMAEKLEVLYISPYYLQAFLFLVGTGCWLVSEAIFRTRLPFWTSLWGWSLVLTNFVALPLVNGVGIFLEEGENKDYLGLLSFVALSYILVPFQAYAAIKGFVEKEEGPWFRTPKTGRITDAFIRGKFYRWIAGVLPGRKQLAPISVNRTVSPYLALATANNRFDSFQVASRGRRWVGKSVLAVLLMISVTIYHLSFSVTSTYAAMDQSTQYLSKTVSSEITLDTATGLEAITAWQLEDSLPSADCTVGVDCPAMDKNGTAQFQYEPGNPDNATTGVIGDPNGKGWVIENDATGVAIAAGTWNFKACIDATDSDGDSAGYGRAVAWKVTTTSGRITSWTQIVDTGTSGSAQDWWVDGYYTITGDGAATTFDAENHLYVEFWNVKTAKGDNAVDVSALKITGGELCGAGNDTMVVSPAVTVPELALIFIPLVLVIPFMMRKFKFNYAIKL